MIFGAGIMLAYGGYTVFTSMAHDGSRLVEYGTASWNGERFDRRAFTAASRHLPINSVVRVTNESNGRSVQVRINDRGPFVHGRILDLSEAAADTLDMKKAGTAPVKIELIESAP
jgi:rare lipoprotein A